VEGAVFGEMVQPVLIDGLNKDGVPYDEIIWLFGEVEIDSIAADGHGFGLPAYAGVDPGEPVHPCDKVVVDVGHDKFFMDCLMPWRSIWKGVVSPFSNYLDLSAILVYLN
jgi:hypothetical protein